MSKVEGVIKVINDTMVVSDKFSKREFVVTEPGKFPQDITYQVTQDKCSMLDSYKVGDQIELEYNRRGRLWTSPAGEEKYFNTLECWRIEKVGNTQAPKVESESDDLPF